MECISLTPGSAYCLLMYLKKHVFLAKFVTIDDGQYVDSRFHCSAIKGVKYGNVQGLIFGNHLEDIVVKRVGDVSKVQKI